MPTQNPKTPVTGESGITMDQAFKLLLLVAVLFAFLYVALLLSSESRQRAGNQATDSAESQLPYDKVLVNEDKLPSLFPLDIPIQEGSEILENSMLTSIDGDLQANRKFESKLSASENYKLYLNYLTSNDWKVVTQDNGSAQKLLRGKNNYQTLMITLVPNPIKKTTTVSLIFSETH